MRSGFLDLRISKRENTKELDFNCHKLCHCSMVELEFFGG